MILDGREKAGLGEIMLIKTQMQRERDKALDDKVLHSSFPYIISQPFTTISYSLWKATKNEIL